MYAWEKPFEQVVALARKNEINCITSASYLRGVYLSFMVFTERLTLYITLLSYSLFGFQVTADIVSTYFLFIITEYLLLLVSVSSADWCTSIWCGSKTCRVMQYCLRFHTTDLRDLELPNPRSQLHNLVQYLQVFPLAQFYNTLQGTLSIIMSNAVSFLAEALISVQRLEAFMLLGTVHLYCTPACLYCKPACLYCALCMLEDIFSSTVSPKTMTLTITFH